MNQIEIKASIPEELPSPKIIVAFRPQTSDEFEAIVAALGGSAAGFSVHSNYASIRLSDAVTVHIDEPKDAPRAVGPTPFMVAFGAVIDDAEAAEGARAA